MARDLIQPDKVFPVKESDLELSIAIDPEVTYYLRPLPVEKLRALTKQHTRPRPNKRTHQMDEVTDNTALANAALDYVIDHWDGVKEHGKDAPCDLEHKLLLPDEVQNALVALARTGTVTPEKQAESFRESP